MSPLDAIRWTGAHWFVPVVFAVGILVGLTGASYPVDFGVANLASASVSMTFTGPLSAAYMAARFYFFPDFLMEGRPSKNGLTSLLVLWWPIVLGTPVAAVAAVCVAARTAPSDLAGFQIVGIVFLTVLACNALAMLAVEVMPVAFAVPILGLGTWAWLTLPRSGENITLRNLNSGFVVCCSSDTVPATTMVVGSGLVVGIVILGVALVCLTLGRVRQRFFMASLAMVGIAVLAFGVGRLAIYGMDREPTLPAVQERPDSRVCVKDGQYEVCLWPEQRSQLSRAVLTLSAFDHAIRRHQLPGATVARQDSAVSPGIAVALDTQSSGDHILNTLALGWVVRSSECGSNDRVRASPEAIAYVALAGGASADSVQAHSGAVAFDAARQVARADGPRWLMQQMCHGAG